MSSAGCIKQTPPVRLDQSVQVAVAYVVDAQTEAAVSDAPAEVKARIEAELAKRNLSVSRIAFEQVSSAFENNRDSARRYAQVKTLANGAPLVLLVELKTQFFSQLQGQYRWQVFGRVSAGRVSETIDPDTDAFEKPVFLQFDHQRGREAMVAASSLIAERVGGVFDGFLKSTGDTLAQPDGGTTTRSTNSLGLVYFVMVDRFHNGDETNDGEIDLKDPNAFHGGDLQGVLAKLDYLKDLGVKTLWLSPVFKMRTEKFFTYGAYHGYWTYDFTQIEPRFGDEALLRKLSDELHARNMKLVLDVVLNHVGPDAPLLKQKPQWFHQQGAITKWNDANELENKDVHGLPDLAQENEEVYQYLLSTSLGWIDRVKPDGFRLDAVKHIPTSFWARYNSAIREHAGRDFILLGELLEGDAEKLSRVWREGRFTHMFDFPLHFAMVDAFCKGAPMTRLATALAQDSLYDTPNNLVTLLDNHDLPRIASACAAPHDGLVQAFTFMFNVRGSPSIIWGTEVALQGPKEPENRQDMRFTDRVAIFSLIKSFPPLLENRTGEQLPLLLEADGNLLALSWLRLDSAVLWLFNNSRDVERTFVVPEGLRSVLKVGRHGNAMSELTGEPVTAYRLQHAVGQAELEVLDQAAFKKLRERASRLRTSSAVRQRVSINAKAPVEQGDSLFVIGSSADLGAWRVEAAKGPFVGGRLELPIAEGLSYEFKLLIRRRDGRTEWEPGENRALFVPMYGSAKSLTLSWGERNG